MDGEAFIWALPYILIAAVMYSIYVFKTSRGKDLFKKAKQAINQGDLAEGVTLLKQALWKANEKPNLEHEILNELNRAYQEKTIVFDCRDYQVLISHYEQLAGKSSHKAISEIKKVQALKKQLIDKMPDLTK